jgi:hypothetical protein
MSSVFVRKPAEIDGRVERCLWFLASLVLLFVFYWEGRSFLSVVCPTTSAPRDFFQEWASARNVWNGLPVYAPHPRTAERRSTA